MSAASIGGRIFELIFRRIVHTVIKLLLIQLFFFGLLCFTPMLVPWFVTQIWLSINRLQCVWVNRTAIRSSRSGILHDLLRLRDDVSVLPKSPLGRAIDYTLALWTKLETFVRHGEVEIDTNLTENAIRPTAVGRKNWMFVGGEDTGERSAIAYTLIESAKRHGHEPYAYLRDVLERLPGMKASAIDALLPGNWQPAGAELASVLAAS